MNCTRLRVPDYAMAAKAKNRLRRVMLLKGIQRWSLS
jgi:hypothetical protein